MKKIILLSINICILAYADAQTIFNKPQSGSFSPTPISSWPRLYNYGGGATNRNFVRQYTPQVATTTISNLTIPNQYTYPYYPCLITTSYTDGLGRPLQEVVRGGIPGGAGGFFANWDVAVVHTYDGAGNEAYQYLPTSFQEFNGANDGKLKANPLIDLPAQYNASYPGDVPYTKNVYDGTMLNRLISQQSPGTLTTVDFSYQCFTSVVELVKRYGFNAGTGKPYEVATTYASNDLYKYYTKDADDKQVSIFKDKAGRVILKKQLVSRNFTTFVNTYAETYYVYDDMDRLRWVLSPEAVNQIATSGSITQPILDGLCYYYEYDDRGRLIKRKQPDKDYEEMVYDNADRLVAMQDGNLRAGNKWSYSVYDCLDRTLATGITTANLLTASDWNTMLYASSASGYASNDIRSFYQTPVLFNQYPNWAGLTNANALTQNFYDDYTNGVISGNSFNTSYNSKLTGSSTYCNLPADYGDARGQLTGTYVSLSNTSPLSSTPTSYATAYFYDDKGRLIQTQADNQEGGFNHETFQYDFASDVASSVLHVYNPNAVSPVPTEPSLMYGTDIQKRYTKDYYSGQTLAIDQSINGAPFTNLSVLTYDAYGRVAQKTNSTVVTNQYTYDINGRLASINKDFFDVNNLTIFFKESVSYNHGFYATFSNEIAGNMWQGFGAAAPKRFYGYDYDYMGRLKGAEFGQWDATLSDWSNATVDYAVSNLTYDLNGNIKTMNQRGQGTSGPLDMDLLCYKYQANSNKLFAVADNATGASANPDFKDDAQNPKTSPDCNTGTADYTYDANGNVLTDVNRGINVMSYTYLNKPYHITSPKGTVDYVYDANGVKLKKIVSDATTSTVTVTNYVGPLVYENNNLKYISHEEGRCRLKPYALPMPNDPPPPDFNYDYFVKDHLGNIRSVVSAALVPYSDYFTDHELSTANTDGAIFANIDEVRDNTPLSTEPGDLMAVKLDGGDPVKSIGTAVLLKVMAGDRLEFNVQTLYAGPPQPDAVVDANTMFNSLLTTLVGGHTYTGMPAGDIPENINTIQALVGNPANAGVYQGLLDMNTDPMVPAAYLSYLFFDENFNLMPSNSSVKQWGATPDVWNTIGTNGPVEATQNGYVLAFIASRTASRPVYGDKFSTKVYRGQLLEEDHYYPFGLTISTNTPVAAERNYIKYNGMELQREEFTDGLGNKSGLELYDYGARMQDPQTGRWWQPEPHAGQYASYSPYAYAFDNPASYIDPTGKDAVKIIGNNTIVVKANYYVQTKNYFPTGDFAYSTDEIAKMNEIETLLNSQGYKVTEGKYNGYNVKFDLNFIDASGAEHVAKNKAINAALFHGHSITNSIGRKDKTREDRFNPTKNMDGDQSIVAGHTRENKYITMNKEHDNLLRQIHEIFHTWYFNNDNGKNGIGSYQNPQMPNASDINQLIYSEDMMEVPLSAIEYRGAEDAKQDPSPDPNNLDKPGPLKQVKCSDDNDRNKQKENK